jgi:alpha-tubulin suppressor-like RCC1 family protein
LTRPVLLPLRAVSVVLSVGLIASSLSLNAAQAAIPIPIIGSISAGGSHTCAVTTAGGAKCWGENQDGRLGDGKWADSTVPVDVWHLAGGVASISAGGSHTCALTTSGGVKCWGDNRDDELGAGTTTNSKVPIDVVGLTSGVSAISAGDGHTCALTTSGGAKCWGDNFEGELGDGTTTSNPTPVDVLGLTSGVAAISAGEIDTCALTTSGGVKCWGYNRYGQLGDGSTTSRSTPVDVVGLTSGVAAISTGGDHTCALTTAGGVKCWGLNASGQLGDSTMIDSAVPVDVTGLSSGVSSISAGFSHTCSVMSAGGLMCWGNNDFGQLGDGTNRSSDTPVGISRTKGRVAAISAGYGHTCALTVSGGVRCWGANRDGQLGDGTMTNSPLPADVFGPTISGISSSVDAGESISSSGQVSVTTTWTGTDPYATIMSYRAQEQINGGAWSDVTLSGPMATSFSVLLTPGNLYHFQILATDSGGHVSVWSPGTGFTVIGVQEKGGLYVGPWMRQPLAGAWGGAVKYSTDLNATAAFRFHSSNAVWIGTKGPGYGSADVYVDGVYVTTVDCNAGSIMERQTLFSIGGLRAEQHKLEIVNLATAGHPRIDIDGFVSFR